MQMYWLFKTEPGDYSYEDLVRDGQTAWTGVQNPQALKNLRSVSPGDEVLFYHTGKEKCVVGVAQAISSSYVHMNGDTVVDIVARYLLRRPVSLREVKDVPDFAEWALVRQPRLSVMPVSPDHWQLIHELAARDEV
jgi:predicted RNA-binding protein with PUA-like domain